MAAMFVGHVVWVDDNDVAYDITISTSSYQLIISEHLLTILNIMVGNVYQLRN